MTTAYEVSIYVNVTDPAALKAAALIKMEKEGCPFSDPGEFSVRDALRWFIDPGCSPPGCEILDSACEGGSDEDETEPGE
jgi:hypothetical protein